MQRRRHRLRRIQVIVLGSTLLMGILGVSYASWTGQLTVASTTTTANLSLQWLTFPIACIDNDGTPGIGQVSSIRDGTDDSVMHFQIANGYPGYIGSCSYAWSNNGTVPVKITSLDIDSSPITSGVPTDFDVTGDTIPDLRITFQNGVGSSYAPGTGGSKSIQVEVLPGAPESSALTFVGHVNFELGS